MAVETCLGLDRLVTMPRNHFTGNRNACEWIATPALCFVLCCIAGSGLAGCSQGAPAAGQTASSAASGADAQPVTPAPSPFVGASAYLTGPNAPPRPSSQPTNEGREFTTVGPLVVEQQADIAAERDGRVTSVSVEIGDHVRRGEVLALLDDRALQAARAEKAARIDSLRAQVQTWESEQNSNAADLRRADAMRAEKILDDEDWEHVKYKLSETTSQVARYRADELAAEADLRAADVELTQSRITAPFDGVVGRRSVHDAQAVKKGDTLFWITAQAPLRVLFTVPESAMASFPRGAKLELTTTDYPHLKQPAIVFRVSPVVDPASGSIEVIGSLEKPSPLLKPGMSMQVKLSPR
jgi:RND family efflux transporter MFP subunit